jgi:hypothetical protein
MSDQTRSEKKGRGIERFRVVKKRGELLRKEGTIFRYHGLGKMIEGS